MAGQLGGLSTIDMAHQVANKRHRGILEKRAVLKVAANRDLHAKLLGLAQEQGFEDLTDQIAEKLDQLLVMCGPDPATLLKVLNIYMNVEANKTGKFEHVAPQQLKVNVTHEVKRGLTLEQADGSVLEVPFEAILDLVDTEEDEREQSQLEMSENGTSSANSPG